MHGLQQEYHRTRFQFPLGKMSLPLLVIRYFFSQHWFFRRWKTFLRSRLTCRVHKGNMHHVIGSSSVVRLLKKCTVRLILFWTAFYRHRCLRRTVLTNWFSNSTKQSPSSEGNSSQQAIKFPALWNPKVSLPFSKRTAICPLCWTTRINPRRPILFLYISL